MKLLRVGNVGNEKPAIMDQDGNYRDLSLILDDFNPKTLNKDTIKKLKGSDIKSFPKLDPSERIGSLSLIHI